MRKRLLLCGAVLSLAACAPLPPQPDLARLYRSCATPPCVAPVILVHGAFGGRLADAAGHEHWPGNWLRLLFGRYRSLALPLDRGRLMPRDDGLRPTGLFQGAGGADFYGRIQETLERAGGFRPAQPGHAQRPGARVFYTFAHDWRRDVVFNARRLADLIDQIRRDFDQPRLRVNVIAHSAGALPVRYYLRYGRADLVGRPDAHPTLAGAGQLGWVVLVGAPNRGSLYALRTLVQGYRVGLGTIPPEVLATFPAAYQMLPDPARPWLVDEDGVPVEEDLYDPGTWRRHRWAVFDPAVVRRLHDRLGHHAAQDYLTLLRRYLGAQLKRARALHRAMDIPIRPRAVRFVVMGSDCQVTADRLLRDGRGRVWFRPPPEPAASLYQALFDPGDGRVTKLSALGLVVPRPASRPPFPVAHTVFLCERHAQLTGNLHFQTNLLNILLSQEPYRDTVQEAHHE